MLCVTDMYVCVCVTDFPGTQRRVPFMNLGEGFCVIFGLALLECIQSKRQDPRWPSSVGIDFRMGGQGVRDNTTGKSSKELRR